jgi:Ca-activated chloride channel family protein
VKRRALRAAGLAALLALAGAPARAAELRILSPRQEPVFGKVAFTVQVRGLAGVLRVELRVDGRLVASPSAPPYSTTVDVGEDNRAHRFEASAITASGIAARAALSTPPIHVDQEVEVALRQLYVTVTRGDEAARGLARGDLKVVDDGRPQSIVTFEGGDAPFTSVLLVDSSESMYGGRLESALRGAQGFATGMRPLDETMLMLFSDHTREATPFSGAADPILASLQNITADGGTSVNDHLFLALELLDGRQGRRVVVLFSDGADVLSALRMKDVVWKAQRSQSAIYWIRLQEGDPAKRFSSAWRNGEANQAEEDALANTVRESGGRIVTLASIDDVDTAYQTILDELRSQYVIGYYPSALRHDGGWRTVEVKAPSGLRARTREGYVDY